MKRMYGLRFMYLIVFGLLVGFMPLSTAVAAALSAPETAIEEASTKLKNKLQEPGVIKDFKQVTTAVEEIIYPQVDFEHISALVLGKNWKAATDEERKRFKQEFQTLLVRTYSRAFLEFKEWSVRFLPLSKDDSSDKVIVKTEVLQPGKQPIAVNYRMLHLKSGEWKAYDIMIEGVSLVTNYRTSFKNEIDKSGSLTAVIDMLEKKNKEALSSKDPAVKDPS
jgi:phospholipid transport system substrate-binding protein